MKFQFWTMGLATLLALVSVAPATTYYIDDGSNDGDVYTPGFTGNESNNGLTPTTPKLTINNLLASTNLLPGDVVLIDTGTYTNNVVIGAGVNGVAGNPIVFQGSTTTRPWGGGTTLTATEGSYVFNISGKYLKFCDLQFLGAAGGLYLNGSTYGDYERIYCISNSSFGTRLEGTSNSNAFRHCVFMSISASSFSAYSPSKGNYVENCISISINSAAFSTFSGSVTNLVNSIGIGRWGVGSFSFTPDAASHNIFFPSERFHYDIEGLEDVQRAFTNWHHNTVAEPKFVNAEGFDFHLLSAAGFISNGVWVTNSAVGYSPGIDFGARE